MSCGPQMPAMPLSMVKAGETVRVSRVKGNEDMKHHLKDSALSRATKSTW